MTSRSRLLLFGAAISMVLGGCMAHPATKPLVGTCLAPTTTTTTTAASGVSAPVEPTGPRVPDVRLACLDGSGYVRLGALDRPAVISLWASWCAPCRAELPGLAAFAKSAAGRVSVVGIDTADTRTGGQSMVSDFSLSYPMLFDPGSLVSNAIGHKVLPVTVFVSRGGTIEYVYDSGGPLDERKIAELAARYLGVPVGG